MIQPLRDLLAVLAIAAVLSPTLAKAQDDPHPLASLQLRTIGPALTSGRISDFAFHPDHDHVYYVAVSSGGLWKTENNGTTWTPIFDGEGSYALGAGIPLWKQSPQARSKCPG